MGGERDQHVAVGSVDASSAPNVNARNTRAWSALRASGPLAYSFSAVAASAVLLPIATAMPGRASGWRK